MAWPQRDIDWKAEFGVESKEALQARLAKVTELETSNTNLQAKIVEQDGSLNSVKATLQALEERVNNPVVPNNNNNNNNRVEIPSVADDENAAFAARMGPLYAQNMSTAAMVLEDQVLRRLSANDPRFSKFEKEVRDTLRKQPLQFRANLDVDKASGKSFGEMLIENIYYSVKGRFTDQIVQDERAGKGDFFVEPARGAGNNGQQQVVTDPTVLTDDDRRVIAKMGCSEATYIATIKQGGPNMGGALSNKTSF